MKKEEAPSTPVISMSDVQRVIQITASRLFDPMSLFKNVNGVVKNGAGQTVRRGLGNTSQQINKVFESPDLIGITHITVRPEDVGRQLAIFTAISCKPNEWLPGTGSKNARRREGAQRNFIDVITKHGGIGGFASSEQDYLRLISEFIKDK